MRLKRIAAGAYEAPNGQHIIRTDGGRGPAGGHRVVWEVATMEPGVGLCICNDVAPGATLREAKENLAASIASS